MLRKASVLTALVVLSVWCSAPALADGIRTGDVKGPANTWSASAVSSGNLRLADPAKSAGRLLGAALKPASTREPAIGRGDHLASVLAVVNVPEPSSLVQLGIGMLALLLLTVRRLLGI